MLIQTRYPLERAGVKLRLDRLALDEFEQKREILLVHGVTYSSHEYDLAYEDYSLARFLAGRGYGVWRLDIAGFGLSDEPENGFLPDSDYAAEDICAALERIAELTGREKIDLLGWSWGTVTAGRCCARHPEHVDRLVLYAPILSGLGEIPVEEPYHHNTWAHAAEDFQRRPDGSLDTELTDPVILELYCSSCWHYDGERSPNGGRRDIYVSRERRLIPLEDISVPALLICGDRDPYLDYERLDGALALLPPGSALEVIPGGAHVLMLEKPFYHDFQARLAAFLDGGERGEP